MTIVRGMGSIDALSVALSCTAYRLLAWLAQTGEVLFDAQQDATGGGLDGGALLLDIRPTGFAHSGISNNRRLSGIIEILEACFYNFPVCTLYCFVYAHTNLTPLPAIRVPTYTTPPPH